MTSGKLENIIKYTKNLNVLYVEDNIYVQQQTIKMLESFFNNIYIASNGKEALDLFNTENLYNLIITDIEMPFVDGVSLICKKRMNLATNNGNTWSDKTVLFGH